MLEAYLDKNNHITIESSKESPFYINGDILPLIGSYQVNNKHIYMANYEIDLAKQYIISDNNNQETLLKIRYFTKTKEFDDKYYYSGNDLGANYTKEFTIFKVWAPVASKVRLLLKEDNKLLVYTMERKDHGVYEIKVKGDLKNRLYNYEITNNGETSIVNDPYAYSSSANSAHSAVININEFVAKDYDLPLVKNINDAIIYELSVRDFSSSLKGIKKEDARRFNAFLYDNLVDENGHKIGISHIKDLGVSHVQLLPILDFATVNELNIDEKYNWGYDPMCYNVIEGSYSSNPNDPTARIKEFIALVDKLHSLNLRVVLDVVFNHTYFYKESMFTKLVPYYYYLIDTNTGVNSNGSFCGNDIDTTKKMAYKYFKDMASRLVRIYKIDGFRYDLMGILDTNLVKEIYYLAKAYNSSFISYGEGWNMPTFLAEDKRCSLNNQSKVPEIAFFNDYFRDFISGKYYNENDKRNGYLTNNTFLANEFIKAMKGSTNDDCYFDLASSSINYVECHDGYTLFDKLALTNKDNSEEERNKINLMCTAATIFALGTPFLQAGQEFLRTKQGDVNSYKSSDAINTIDWSLVSKNYKNIKAIKDFIDIRKTYDAFKLISKKDINKCIDGKIIDNRVVKLSYFYNGQVIMLMFNPTNKLALVPIRYDLRVIANNYGYVKQGNELKYNNVKLKPYEFLVLTK